MIYFITDKQNIKIGYTKNSVEKRLKQLQTSCPEQLYILGWIDGDLETESFLHKKFSKSRIRYNGEWFRPAEDLISYINEHNRQEHIHVIYEDGKVMPCFSISLIQ